MSATTFQGQEPITFEKLPEAISFLIGEVIELRKTLSSKQESVVPEDKWMSIDELKDYLPDHPTKNTIYSWVSTRKIPNHKGGKKLRFLKSEIDQWLSSGKRKSESELQAEAAAYQSGKKGVKRYE